MRDALFPEAAICADGDNWLNERYFRSHEMRPLFVEELAVHPDIQGRGLGAFMLDRQAEKRDRKQAENICHDLLCERRHHVKQVCAVSSVAEAAHGFRYSQYSGDRC